VTRAGTTDPAAAIITRYCQSFGGRPEASVIGSNVRTDCASASLANGVIGHALDFDDYHDETVIHASAACIQAILAVAEHKGFLAKPKGDPENPLSFEELAAKYRNAAKLAVSEKTIEALIGAVRNLETIRINRRVPGSAPV
jgi:hypothetical protein